MNLKLSVGSLLDNITPEVLGLFRENDDFMICLDDQIRRVNHGSMHFDKMVLSLLYDHSSVIPVAKILHEIRETKNRVCE